MTVIPSKLVAVSSTSSRLESVMSKKASTVIGATIALPLLSHTMAGFANASDLKVDDIVGVPFELTERELDTVTAGRYEKLPVLPRDPGWGPIKEWPPMMTTMAIGEEGGGYDPRPIVKPIEEPPIATTLALGEEGGFYPFYPVSLE